MADATDDTLIVTAAEVAAASNGQVDAADPRLEPLIRGAQAAIRHYCGWHVTPSRKETLTLDGEGSSSVRLRSGHVTDVSSLTVGGVALADGVWDWSEAGMIRLRRPLVFPDRFRAVEVTLTHGWDEVPELATVITRAVLGACASPMGATSESAGQVSIRWGRAGMTMSSEDRVDLAPYRLQSWA